MDQCHQIEPWLQVKINDTLAQSVHLRSHPGLAGRFDVVVEDAWLGAFALHNDFDLSVKEKDADWRPVSLDDLRKILVRNTDIQDSDDETNNHKMLESTPRGEPNVVPGGTRSPVRLGTIIGLDACVQRIQALLYRASIPHLRAGATFVVPSMLSARECLRRGGFRQDQQYESVLFDSESGIAIRLLERGPQALR
ncbi:MAG: hypothetical protein ACLQBK_26550 [Candidatus Sulfotelmatobacter sp.]